ncbi:hypothetical protein BDW02DRAFT_274263 [Decorospora gaudefroyi]|uniref:Uncharacterized protein n=1 Tax=Decorospora gaudefroyi TaxID=184978 RepID=A0A6A5KWJ1_9PLEO|nr:hypothetical protein BDW02DRAFT_274263 [Decorospora gaudefroyi]
MSQLPHLPRELIDTIISSFISLHDHDPAYQWTQLQHITHHHRSQIEQHFRASWLPHLRLIVQDPGMLVSGHEVYIGFGLAKSGIEPADSQSGNDTVRFTVDVQGPQSLIRPNRTESGGADEPIGYPDVKFFVVFGEGVLNKGYAGGGISNEICIPSRTINVEPRPWEINLN